MDDSPLARRAAKALATLGAVLLTVLGALVLYQVVARYTPGVPAMLWTEEVARGLLIWLVMLGAGLGVLEESHFRLTAFIGRAPRVLNWVARLAALGAGGYLIYSAIAFVSRGSGRVSLVSGLPAVWVYSAMLVGGVLIAAAATLRLLRPAPAQCSESEPRDA